MDDATDEEVAEITDAEIANLRSLAKFAREKGVSAIPYAYIEKLLARLERVERELRMMQCGAQADGKRRIAMEIIRDLTAHMDGNEADLTETAAQFAAWCIRHHQGDLLDRGLAAAKALADYHQGVVNPGTLQS